MASLPPASQLNDAASLSAATRILFEPSLPLETHLIPALSSCSLPFDSYSQLISACERQVNTWDSDTQAHFIAAHPRIGEVSNLSALSQKEQASQATPPEVLEQLEVRLDLYRCTVR